MTLSTLFSQLRSDIPYNLHSHTQFCDGHAPMEDFAKAAAEAGFSHYAFTPHSPVPIESPCNMKFSDVPAFLLEVERLRGIYGDRVQLLSGMEVDYLSDNWGPANEYFASLGLDVIIGSVHFIPSQDGELIDIDGSFQRFSRNMEQHFRNDIRYVVDKFYDQSMALIEAGGFDILGHFDKIGHNASLYRTGIENEPWYAARVAKLIDLITDAGVVVEINTKAYNDHGRFFPSRRYWPELKRRGVRMVVNSDAHYPHLIDASRTTALTLL
ncbi:MAG: histidinol-phosphatase [Muribaculaceae bacterium]|nr:histidinol-phosphatase [Muribaculaceae bacterium]